MHYLGKGLQRKQKPLILILVVFLLAPSTIQIADGEGETTNNLCRNCHGGRYGAYLTLSQLSMPSEVGNGDEFNVSVRVDISGNLDSSLQQYWLVDFDITLNSQGDMFSFSPATHSYNNHLPSDSIVVSWQLTADQGVGIDSLQVHAFSVAQHFGRTGTDQLSGNIEVVGPNNPPQLSATSFSPDEGGVNQLFNFQVTWTDLDNDPPMVLSVIIDDVPFALTAMDSSSEEPRSGMRYSSSSMTLPQGFHTYFFQGSDGEDSIRLPSIDTETDGPQGLLIGMLPGPFVGYAPTIHEGSLLPLLGDNETDFTYSVLITPEDDLANTSVVFWLNGIASYIVPITSDEGEGQKRFNFTTQLSSGVSHFHYFTVTNSFGSTRLPVGTSTFEGPIIVGDVLSKATIDPTQGDEQTSFTFSINYSKPVGIAPSNLSLVIDGVDVPMNVTSQNPDWNEENQFTVQLDMAVGLHSYHYIAVEGNRSYRIPDQGELYLNVNRFDSDPWLSNASTYAAGNLVFNDSSVTDHNDIWNVSRPLVIEGTEIEVRITFHDAEGDDAEEGSVVAWVDGLAYPMQRIDENNATLGQVWSLLAPKLDVGYNHFVWFTATSSNSDISTGGTVRYPQGMDELFPLPDVEEANIPPVIQPPTNGEMMLSPLTGGTEEAYAFLIEVMDSDWDDSSVLTVWLELDGEIYTLQPLNGSDHRDGTLYGITLNVSEGEHNHRFVAQDAEVEVTYPLYGVQSGPVVQANLITTGATSHIFTPWAWWLILLDSLLIIGGIGWSAHTLIHARRAVKNKTSRKFSRESVLINSESASEIKVHESSIQYDSADTPITIDIETKPRSEPVKKASDIHPHPQPESSDDWADIDW